WRTPRIRPAEPFPHLLPGFFLPPLTSFLSHRFKSPLCKSNGITSFRASPKKPQCSSENKGLSQRQFGPQPLCFDIVSQTISKQRTSNSTESYRFAKPGGRGAAVFTPWLPQRPASGLPALPPASLATRQACFDQPPPLPYTGALIY